MNIILTGMRGSGKTELGRLVATKLNRPFLDLDREIEKAANQKIAQIVEQHGWLYFRQLETEICQKISQLDNYIIATGGGTLINDKNVKLLKKNGRVILLKADIEILAARIKHSQNRPSLQDKKDFLSELKDVWAERKAKYEQVADLTINTNGNNPETKAKKIITEINNRRRGNS